jgi:hypothetical protein
MTLIGPLLRSDSVQKREPMPGFEEANIEK